MDVNESCKTQDWKFFSESREMDFSNSKTLRACQYLALLNVDAAAGTRVEIRVLNVHQKVRWDQALSADISTGND